MEAVDIHFALLQPPSDEIGVDLPKAVRIEILQFSDATQKSSLARPVGPGKYNHAPQVAQLQWCEAILKVEALVVDEYVPISVEGR